MLANIASEIAATVSLVQVLQELIILQSDSDRLSVMVDTFRVLVVL